MFLTNITETPDARIREIVQMAIDQATQQFSPSKYEGQFPRNGFGIQELRAKHIGGWAGTGGASAADSWILSINAGSQHTWISWFDITVHEDCYLIITGVMNLTPNAKATGVKFTANGEELPIVYLEEIYAYDVSRVYLTAPFIVKPKSGFKAEVYASAATSERLGLLGYCLAKRTYLINKTATVG